MKHKTMLLKQIPLWDTKSFLLKKIEAYGGFINCHAHFDKAALVTPKRISAGHLTLEEKWEYFNKLKKKYTQEDLYRRMRQVTETMIAQGVKAVLTHVDVDSSVKLLPTEIALQIKKEYRDQIIILVATQTLKGALEKKERFWIEKAAELVDIIGGLPARDWPRNEAHMEFLLRLAKSQGKRASIHIDQENNPNERESELLARKTIELGMEGRVLAVHALSLGAQEKSEIKRIAKLLKEAGITIVVSPGAAISTRMLPFHAPLHNAIAPVPDLLEAGVNVCLGTDNIFDPIMPFADGDMWFETRVLMEATRFYDPNAVAKIASINGRKALGLEK
jgi:cytosine/adenosine deaminase-related metal-dependent hydrolase